MKARFYPLSALTANGDSGSIALELPGGFRYKFRSVILIVRYLLQIDVDRFINSGVFTRGFYVGAAVKLLPQHSGLNEF